MATIKVKEGKIIHPFGPECAGYDSQSELTEGLQELLADRFPEDVELVEDDSEGLDNTDVPKKKSAKK